MIATLLIVALFGLEAEPMCFASDVQRVCCPSACAAKNGKEWTHANEILRGCMLGLGCKSGVESATVFMRCSCPSKGGTS
ncbi:MAG TPA: hypothetical protein VIV60_12680 [Polyangiaceae bacterium]